jgi:hypothetical protein
MVMMPATPDFSEFGTQDFTLLVESVILAPP